MPYKFVSKANLPTKWGNFEIHGFEDPISKQDHILLSYGIDTNHHNANNLIANPVLLRIHSECLTGDAFASLKCECGPQLHSAFAQIVAAGQGVILYLRQEGRGIGIINKISAYALQDQGHDTLEANLLLGLPADARTYEMCQSMLQHVGVSKVNLLTNNPKKLAALANAKDIEVVARIPLYVGLNPHNSEYINTKQNKMQHLK
jgi:GTP cyclohydrolase II